jgi:prephenate dehydratase
MTAVRTVAPRVAYQGEPGAYGELAIMRQWGGEATPVSATTFPETLSLLGRGGADYAVIPVWNSTIGEILDTTLLLTHHASRVETVAELTVPVVHCLLGLPAPRSSSPVLSVAIRRRSRSAEPCSGIDATCSRAWPMTPPVPRVSSPR